MTTSHNFKNFQSTVNRLVVNRAAVSSRFRQKLANSKTRIGKPLSTAGVKAEAPSSIENDFPEMGTSQADTLLQTISCEIEHPIACPVPVLSVGDVETAYVIRKENWFSKLFSLKPQA